MNNNQDDPLCLVFIPTLIALLYKEEQVKGSIKKNKSKVLRSQKMK